MAGLSAFFSSKKTLPPTLARTATASSLVDATCAPGSTFGCLATDAGGALAAGELAGFAGAGATIFAGPGMVAGAAVFTGAGRSCNASWAGAVSFLGRLPG